MALKVSILGSGSAGNSTCIHHDAFGAILIDAGFSGRVMKQRLADLDLAMEDVKAICVTHEHKDHIAGLSVMAKRHPTPIYGNTGTIEAIESQSKKPLSISWNIFTNGSAFDVGPFLIEAFSVPHDAYDPVGFIVQCEEIRIGLVSDAGVITNLVRERLRGCHVLVLEANYDEQLLQDSERPWYIKQRIMGRQGHLSNTQAAELLEEIAGPTLQQVFLVHLSEDCNRTELALKAVQAGLERKGRSDVQVCPTFQDKISAARTFSPEGSVIRC